MTTIRHADMAVRMSDGPLDIRTANAGEMAVLHAAIPAGTDFAPVLNAIDPRGCMVPHWMYVVSGELRMVYPDGRVDSAREGEVLYAEPGHLPEIPVDTKFVEISPAKAANELMDKVMAIMAAQA